MTPQPLQRKRTKGFRYPEGAKVLTVTRGTVYGNPHKIIQVGFEEYVVDGYVEYSGRNAAELSVMLYRRDMENTRKFRPAIYAAVMKAVSEADYVACWCEIGQPCHRNVLIELAAEWAAAQAEPARRAGKLRKIT